MSVADPGDGELQFPHGEPEAAVVEAVGLLPGVLFEVSLAFPFHELVEEFFQEVNQGWGFSPFLPGLDLIQDTIQPIGLPLLLCLPYPLTSYTQFFLVPLGCISSTGVLKASSGHNPSFLPP